HAHLRLVDLSSQTPSGGGQRADPGQKHEPGGTAVSRVERDLTTPRPVTEKRLMPLQENHIEEPDEMSFVRSALVAAVVLGMVTQGAALAQTATPPSSISSKVDEVSKWTSKQWNRAKAKWEKETEKWAGCQRQSKDQNLTGRKSWSFLASCMTS